MNGKIKLFLIAIISLFIFMPITKAMAASYVVKNISTNGETTIGTYTNYATAKTTMNNQSSTNTKVAAIYKDGKLINAKYALFKLKYSTSSPQYYNLYQNVSDTTAFTYVSSVGAIDSAFIDYDDAYGRAKIKISGFTGWIDINAGTIVPLSLMNGNVIQITGKGVNVRSSYSTSSSSLGKCDGMSFVYSETKVSGGYTWYKINYNGKVGWVAYNTEWAQLIDNTLETYYNDYSATGNLIHHYDYYLSSGSVNNYFTNLGPSPSWMKKDGVYYSFDGNYFYTSVLTMLDDYRNNRITNSSNASSPHYPYYLYLPNRAKSTVTAEALDAQITNTASKLYGQGKYFKEAEELYGMNALSAFSTAKNESASGTSTLAMNKNNVFGYGAYDSCPYDCAKSYASVRDSIMDYAKNGLTSYMTAGASYYFGTHSGNKLSGRAVKYASDPYWGEKMAHNALLTDKNQNYKDYLYNTIGVTANGKYNVSVYKEANTNTVLYKMQNKNTNFKLYNLSVTVIDKINGFYKVYADSSDGYGYIKESDLYVSNKQPVITANDQTIQLGSAFNPLSGVSAIDAENGNLTNKITYSGSVNTNVSGTYNITYSVKDNSNFNASKTVKIIVQGVPEPVINAENKEVPQYTQFDYLKDVVASDSVDGDITKNITYTGTVNTDVKGTYDIVYSVTNTNGKKVTKKVTITVIDNEKPYIEAKNKVLYLNEKYNLLDDVTAFDKEDGNLTDKITYEGEVDTSKIGAYEVVYSVEDSVKQKVTKKITYTVEEKILEKKKGKMYLEHLTVVNGKLNIKGYNTIIGINNDLGTNIKYELVLKNQNNNNEVVLELDRLTDKKQMTIPIISSDGKDYTYSWFSSDIEIDDIPEGDYTLYIKSSTNDCYSETIVQNILLNEQVSQFNTNNKYVTIINDYMRNDIPINFIVRDDELGFKGTAADTNQYSYIEKIEFRNNNFYLKAASYSVNLDMRSTTKLERKMIFENINTFDKYTYDLGNLSKGSFNISLVTSDKFGITKDNAWFEKEMDISELPKGVYTIYILNKSNVSDYGELNDLLFTDLSKAQAVINDKKYEFVLNENLRNRIELKIS